MVLLKTRAGLRTPVGPGKATRVTATRPATPARHSLIPYHEQVASTRGGTFFQVHPYPTKINPEAIRPFIESHTRPGEIVYDCFAGSCSTGVAAALSGRKAICNDLGALPTWIGRALFTRGDAEKFRKTAMEQLHRVAKKLAWLYQSADGEIRHTFWSDFVRCPHCRLEVEFFATFVNLEAGGFRKTGKCPGCKGTIASQSAERVMERVNDPLLRRSLKQVKRRPVRIFSDGCRDGRPPVADDLEPLVRAAKQESLRKAVPFPFAAGKWGEMHRAGYHAGITHLHHFYTLRNFLALQELYRSAQEVPEQFREPYKLALSSYNVANSTIMTRFVFKTGKTEPVITSAQPGALYVPHCPVEKNVFRGVERKISDVAGVMQELAAIRYVPTIVTGPAQRTPLKANSIDYIFTDPPFGGNIQYSELNVLSEAWLGLATDSSSEAIMSSFQKKGLAEYEQLLGESFAECFRVLKAGRAMTVVFHSAQKSIWGALRASLLKAGFEIVDAGVLDKKQASFKQVTAAGSVSKDPVIFALKPGRPRAAKSAGSPRPAIDSRFEYSAYIAECLRQGRPVALDAQEFRQEQVTIGTADE